MKPSDWSRANIAITGMNAKPDNPGPGVAVARCIKEADEFNGSIIGLGYDVLDPGLYLNEIVQQTYLLPYPSSGEQVLLERIEQIHQQTPLDYLIPVLDAELPSFIRLRQKLEVMGIKMLLPDSESLEKRNKDNLSEIASAIGIKTPKTKKITNASFFYDCHNSGWSYPLVVKGIFYDAHVVRNSEEAVSAFRSIAAQWGYPVLVQEFLEGNEVNLCAVGDGKGNISQSVTMRKQALTEKGKAWAGITVSDQNVENAATLLVNELKWAGALEVEMLIDKKGNYYLIEINPRFPAWIYLSKGANCNLPKILLDLIDNHELTKMPVATTGQMFIRYAQEKVITLQEFESMTMYGQSLTHLTAEPSTASEIYPNQGARA